MCGRGSGPRPSSSRGVGSCGSGRLGALNGLVADIPAPVLGQLIGYSPNIIAEHARTQGVDWATYAALKSRETNH